MKILRDPGRECEAIEAASVFLLIPLLLASFGCNRTKPPAPIPTPTPVVNTSNDSSSEKVEPIQSVQPDVGKSESSPSTSPKSIAEPETTASESSASKPIPDGGWTTQRLIGLTSKGPVTIDLMMRVGGLDLDAANSEAVQPIQKSLLSQLGENAEWTSLLDLPLIKSGWLGNLVAEGDQASQLISMYDQNKDELVQADELAAFLTRGLSRAQPMSISDSGSEPNPDTNKSPFGVLDIDEDNVLSAQELEMGSKVLARLDFNSDSSISLAELSPAATTSMMENGSMGRSMLQVKSLVISTKPVTNDEKSNRKQLQSKIRDVAEYYSFLGSIDRQQWSSWNDAQWGQVDGNGDEKIDKTELGTIFTVDPSIKLAVDLSSPNKMDEETTWYRDTTITNSVWSSDSRTGQLRSADIDLLVRFEDVLSPKLKTLLRNRLTEALKNAQIKQFLVQQLQLKENALEIVDADSDQLVSDDELENVWRWLALRQSARVQGRWMIAARPWFQILDTDRNQSLSEFELSRMPELLGSLDANRDGEIDAGELPLVVSLQLSRQDQRVDLRGLQFGENAVAEGDQDADWFSAMDTNRDGTIGKQEFLGSISEFQALDGNKDGFISESEVY